MDSLHEAPSGAQDIQAHSPEVFVGFRPQLPWFRDRVALKEDVVLKPGQFCFMQAVHLEEVRLLPAFLTTSDPDNEP
jgi:hypothetical protein